MAPEVLLPGAPSAGDIVGGKYRLEHILSEGGGGVVWKALAPDQRAIALKFLKWSPLKSRQVVAEKFKNEFAILKSLSHPHIAQIYDFGLDPASESYFFTSELLVAGDLKTMIGAPIPIIEELLLQALRALEYLRGHKLLHLDIKPQNLLLRQEGAHPVLALIDFGLATFRPPDRPGGTANYIPPEMIVRRLDDADAILEYPPPDHRSDLYSLGVTFYYLLTGTQPFCVLAPDGKRVDSAATLQRHLSFDPPQPSAARREIPSYLDRIVMKLMARHPDERYPSAIVAAQALQHSSPNNHEPESPQTLLAYLPKEGKLIGRRHERTILEESIRSIAEKKPHVAPIICIAGGRGCGRSRLVAFVKPFAQQLEMDVRLVDDEAPASAFEEDGSDSREQPLLILVDDLDRHLSASTQDPEMTPHPSGETTAEGTRAALAILLRRLKLQQRLKAPPGRRCMLIFAINTDRAPIANVMSELEINDTVCHTIDLNNFTNAEVAEYLAVLLGEPPHAAVVEQLMRCTNGNPLFLTEHLEEMIAKGQLFSLSGRPDAKTLQAIGIDFSRTPPSKSLRRTICEKMELLPQEARDLALLIACWNRPVSIEELRETSAHTAVSHELLLLVSAGLLRREGKNGRFTFVNALAAQIIRGGGNINLVRRFHDVIAAHLRRRHRPSSSGDIDLHVAYGGDRNACCTALERLAGQALRLHEPLLAAEHFEELIRQLPPDNLTARADALSQLGCAYEKSRRFQDAQAAYRRMRLLKAPGDLLIPLRIKAAEQLGLMAMRRRDLISARHHFQEAIDIAQDRPDLTVVRLRLENDLAGIDLRDGRFEEALERYERTAAAAEQSLTEEERNTITNNELGQALLRSGNPCRAIPLLERDLAQATSHNDVEHAANLHLLLGDALRHEHLQEFDQALTHYQQGLAIATEHHLVELEVRLHNSIGNLYFTREVPSLALEHYEEGLKLAQQVEGETTSVELMIGMGLAAQRLGRPEETIEYFEAALDFSSGPKGMSAGLIRRYRPTIYVSLGDAYYQRQDFEHAEKYLKEALSLDAKQILTPDIRYSLYGTYVEIFLARGEREVALRYLPTLTAIAQAFPPARAHLNAIIKRMERC